MAKKRNRTRQSTSQTDPASEQDVVEVNETEQEDTVAEDVNENQDEIVQEEVIEEQESSETEDGMDEAGDEIEGVTSSPEVIEDNVTPKAVIVEPVVPTAVIAPEPTPIDVEIAVNVETSATDYAEGDCQNVTDLKLQLEALHKALSVPGHLPEDFARAAKIASTITKHVVKYPKAQVLETLLAFFKENKDGVCSPMNFMKGSTTLPAREEQQVGLLYGLFNDLVRGQIPPRINESFVLQHLQKAEIVTFYKKKVAGIKASL